MKNMKMNTCSLVTYSGNLGVAKIAISIEGALRWGCTTLYFQGQCVPQLLAKVFNSGFLLNIIKISESSIDAFYMFVGI